MPFDIEFQWEGKQYRAVASRRWQNGVPLWKVTFPSGRFYEFMWNNQWVHFEHPDRQMRPELKNTICWAIERHPDYRKEMGT